MVKYVKASRDGRFWYGIPEIYFIWNGEWGDPEIAYDGLVFNIFSIGIEEMYWNELKEELGREPTDDEFAKYMRDNDENIKFQLAYELMPSAVEGGIVDEIDFYTTIPGTYTLEDINEKIKELRETTIINDTVWDKVYDVFFNAVGDDYNADAETLTEKINEAAPVAQETLIDEVVNPDNYRW